MTMINKEVLKSTKPCADRWKNYLEFYSDFNGSFDEFLELDKISHDDKIWVAKKVLNKNQLVHFATLCAQSVVQIYNERYPHDKRISDCVEYLLTITDFSSLSNEQREKLIELRERSRAARAAAYATDAAARAAAYATDAAARAADAAAYATDVADAAAYAAYAAYAADDAARAAAYAARKTQQELNLKFLSAASKIVGEIK